MHPLLELLIAPDQLLDVDGVVPARFDTTRAMLQLGLQPPCCALELGQVSVVRRRVAPQLLLFERRGLRCTCVWPANQAHLQAAPRGTPSVRGLEGGCGVCPLLSQ